jgi:hypothetical protein
LHTKSVRSQKQPAKNMKYKMFLTSGGVSAFLGAAVSTYAQPASINGSYDPAFGSALSVQTVGTDYGTATAASGGNQLDAGYGLIASGNLYLFFAGNTSDGNSLQVYLSTGQAGGESTFNVSGGSYTSTGTQNMDGSVFSPGFSATEALDVNTYAGTIYANIFNLVAGTGGYAGSTADAGGTISGVYNVTLAVNESSAAGVGSNTGAGALGVTTGWEFAIPLSALNNSSSIEVLADIGSDGGSGSLSNQFLAPNNVSGYPSTFNFGSTPGVYFTVAVPEPSSMVLFGLSGLTGLLAIRRRK